MKQAGSPVLWCRRCGKPVRPDDGPDGTRAVHTASGEETGTDGHHAAPVDWPPASRL
jgi:hypothetical protein